MPLWRRAPAAFLLTTALAASCRSAGPDTAPPIIQPGAPGEPSRAISAEQASDLSGVRHGPDDVRFMQRMIPHHAQALEMAALVPARTAREEIRALALRIQISQADEIQMMEDWLEARGAPVPREHLHGGHGAALMPGMLSAEEMARLAARKGDAFDRLFLESMIEHHEGALLMVRELFSSPRGGQAGEIFTFASDVEADQQMEIDRMRALLATIVREHQP